MLRILELLDLAHRLRNILNIHTRELVGLSLEQTGLLYRLDASGGQITVAELAAESRRAGHTITAMVDILEREGMVVRRRNQSTDRRRVWVVLTDLWSSKLQVLEQAAGELIAPTLIGPMAEPFEQKLEEILRPLRALLPD